MNIQTKYLGEITIDPKKIVTFANGLPGFKNEKQFILLPIPEAAPESFQTLQSIQTPELAFVVTNPYQIYHDYEFRLDQPTIDQLAITSEQDLFILTIVTLTSPFEQSTINLKAPIIINVKTKRGKQYILNDDTYPTKAPLVNKDTKQSGGD
ncbi:MAG TPA: flagellar assembly protein FliW [Bacillota bacterium]|nr:flagellar assembly protein FliW [Bacillota bacterium]